MLLKDIFAQALGPFLWSILTKQESDKNGLRVFKHCMKKRDLTVLILDGDVKTVLYATIIIIIIIMIIIIIIIINFI